MSLLRVVFRELVFRKLGFLLGVFAVAVAVGCALGQIVILRQHDRQTDEILAEHEAVFQRKLDKLDDGIRKAMTIMGVNLVIFAKEGDLSHFDAEGWFDRYMPEDYAQHLGKSGVVTIRHLAAALKERVFVPEVKRHVMLHGTLGETNIAGAKEKDPFIKAVPRGQVRLGHELRRRLEQLRTKESAPREPINPGDTVTILGRNFVVSGVQPIKLGPDDMTAWFHLRDVQEMLDHPGKINALYAIGCECSAGRLGVIREEIASILPDTRVEEFGDKATARAEARNLTAASRDKLLLMVRQERGDLRARKETLLEIILPLLTLGTLAFLAILAFANARERRGEVGLYRALGWRMGQVLRLFLARALLVGVVGTLLGLIAALMAGRVLGEGYAWLEEDPLIVGAILIGAPLASLLAAWLPALIAARQDPAVILQQELS